jgi:hypothetical protein
LSNITGPVIKNGSAAFTFPVGKTGSFNPVAMTAPAAGSSFSAQYLQRDAKLDGYDTSLRAATLARVSGCEYWDIKRLAGTSNVTLTFSYGDSCSGSNGIYITDPTRVRIAHWTGSTWENLGNGASAGTTSGTVSTGAPVSSFSPFTFASTDIIANPLPVRLLSFSASKQNGRTLLKWQADNEINFDSYVVERSTDGINYIRIGNVARTGGSGTQHYSFTDETPAKGKNFYRLRMNDLDGSRRYSAVEQLLYSDALSVSIYPNPASDEIKIVSAGKISGVSIADATGRTVKKMISGTGNRYNISSLVPGVYFVSVTDEYGTAVSKILKR